MVVLASALLLALPLIHALPAAQQPFSPDLAPTKKNKYLTPDVKAYIDGLLAEWDSPGMSVAIVRKDGEGGWLMEAEGYGIAGRDGRPMTGDSLHGIASNSKLFTALSVGLLIHNESLQTQLVDAGKPKLDYTTKIKDLLPEWKLMDPVASELTNLEDMQSHRTGLPRHDASGQFRKGGIPEMISKLRYLRPSAGFRKGFQYNNLMYESLTELPHALLNVTFEEYVQENLFSPLNMTSSTLSVAKAQALPNGQLASGYLRSGRNLALGKDGKRVAIEPYFIPEGQDEIWRGAGGVLTSARDLTMWLAMLLNKGKHPFTNETVVPEDAVQRAATPITVADGKAKWPEKSIVGYGMGQEIYSYQGKQIIEHGGSNIGFKTQVARFPNDNLGIAVLSNDEEFGTALFDVVKWKLVEDILGLPLTVDWDGRSKKQIEDSKEKDRPAPYPENPSAPSSPFEPSASTFSHPTYGSLRFCPVASPLADSAYCSTLLSKPEIQPFLNSSLDERPSPLTLISAFDSTFAQFIRLTQFDGDVFNLTTVFTNGGWARLNGETAIRERWGPNAGVAEWQPAEVAENEGLAEWISGSAAVGGAKSKAGWAFRGGFWGKGSDEVAPPLESLGCKGKYAAEVWFEADA